MLSSSSPLSVLLILALTSSLSFVCADSSSSLPIVEFDAKSYLKGDWSVARHLLSYSTSVVDFDAPSPPVRWTFASPVDGASIVDDSYISGRGYVNGTIGQSDAGEDIATPSDIALRVSYHSASSGRFMSGPHDDALSSLFNFAFVQAPGSVAVSVGEWHGSDLANCNYLFTVASPDRFTIVISPRSGSLAQAADAARQAADRSKVQDASKRASSDDDDDEDEEQSAGASSGHTLLTASSLAGGDSVIYIGHRVHQHEPKTFFGQYGTMHTASSTASPSSAQRSAVQAGRIDRAATSTKSEAPKDK